MIYGLRTICWNKYTWIQFLYDNDIFCYLLWWERRIADMNLIDGLNVFPIHERMSSLNNLKAYCFLREPSKKVCWTDSYFVIESLMSCVKTDFNFFWNTVVCYPAQCFSFRFIQKTIARNFNSFNQRITYLLKKLRF